MQTIGNQRGLNDPRALRNLPALVAVAAFAIVAAVPMAQESDNPAVDHAVTASPVTANVEEEKKAPAQANQHVQPASDEHDPSRSPSPSTPEQSDILKISCGKAKQAVSRHWMDVIVYGRCDHALREDAEAWAISKLVAEVVLRNPLCITNARGAAYKISESRYLSYATCWLAGR